MATINIIIIVLVLIYFTQCDAVCEALLGKGVSKCDAESIVCLHNKLRSDIANGKVAGQPKAYSMLAVKWDDFLASRAQEIAETCVFQHVKVNDSRFLVGQNLYLTETNIPGGTANWNAAILAWYDEHFDYVYGSEVYNHYTQLVWANTTLIGCGYSYYQTLSCPDWYSKYYVCNYGPAGNYRGMPPYARLEY